MQKSRTISVQTDDPAVVEKNAKKLKLASPLAPKGKFPCRIGACEHELPHGRMIPHIRYFHSNKFYEVRFRSIVSVNLDCVLETLVFSTSPAPTNQVHTHKYGKWTIIRRPISIWPLEYQNWDYSL